MKQPTLVGVAGFFDGETFPLEFGKPITVGRSRSADVSLRRTRRYRELPPESRDTNEIANTVSGTHFMITAHGLHAIEIQNLSGNGTKIDGKPVEATVTVEDAMRYPHVIRFGSREAFRLEVRECEG